jgi:hypothetical protein
MEMNTHDLIRSIYSKVTAEEKQFLESVLDEHSVGILITMEEKIETEQARNIKDADIKARKRTKFDPKKFQEAYSKFVAENKLEFDMKGEWAKVVEKMPTAGLRLHCERNGPHSRIRPDLTLKQGMVSQDGAVSADMETLLVIEQNQQAEQTRLAFIEDYSKRQEERLRKIAEFRMNWRSK